MVPGCVVMNIGAMWEKWSGGLYPATMHRVIHLSNTFRVSIPFFFEPNFDAPVDVLPAAQRKAEAEGREILLPGDGLVYGDFLVSKVTNNFKY
jgi:isopenicillin N synthase-like dioxygenase